MRTPEYFPDAELACRCGCGLLPPAASVVRLYGLRIYLGRSLSLSSGARCVKHNKMCGGRDGSIHLPADLRKGLSKGWGGAAFDISCKPGEQAAIIAAALLFGFRGFGIYEHFLHIDDASRPHIEYWR